jgi:alpha-tubulin suppressor-like RCC1 family protein
MATPEEIQTCINALTTSSSKDDFVVLATCARAANTGLEFTVATVNDLPDLSTTDIGDGQVVFVESIGVPVVSNSVEWIGIDGRILRRDADIRPLLSWGLNTCGAFGDGTTIDNPLATREVSTSLDWLQVSRGGSHAAAIKTDGTIWSWGQGVCGALGDGTVVDKCSPVQEFYSATNWCQVSAGSAWSSALKIDGTLWGWGSGGCGRLGDGFVSNRCSPVQEFFSTTNWCQVDVFNNHTAAIKTDGTLWVWGANRCATLGDGTDVDKCSPVQEISSSANWCCVGNGWLHTAAIKTDGTLWSWGGIGVTIGDGRLGDGNDTPTCSPVQEVSSSVNWSRVSAGGYNSSAIKTDGTMWNWGSGAGGTIGDGTTVSKCSPVQEFYSATNWCQVSAGFRKHFSALKTDGTLWSWGCNCCGVLGDNTNTTKCSPIQEITSSANWCQVSAGDFANPGVSAIKLLLEP